MIFGLNGKCSLISQHPYFFEIHLQHIRFVTVVTDTYMAFRLCVSHLAMSLFLRNSS